MRILGGSLSHGSLVGGFGGIPKESIHDRLHRAAADAWILPCSSFLMVVAWRLVLWLVAWVCAS